MEESRRAPYRSQHDAISSLTGTRTRHELTRGHEAVAMPLMPFFSFCEWQQANRVASVHSAYQNWGESCGPLAERRPQIPMGIIHCGEVPHPNCDCIRPLNPVHTPFRTHLATTQSCRQSTIVWQRQTPNMNPPTFRKSKDCLCVSENTGKKAKSPKISKSRPP